ncbi:SAM-dependent methyltransferase [Pleionea sp. CnH1-48]|uniref:SAM-dependent methyltransferase n=1 Tax=Pleionea sp. CnH1-48 TaxID=2954494 RepID=UPI002096EDB5|nr:SAM-dependent methyltransferase [Pleionea sp. CnH1-48]MCO7226886.1 SAM-dependent methyltransferase [Pleionea sp. CnH1-48]
MSQSGSLVCVGLGMTLGSHISPLSSSYIKQADVVFVGASDGIVELWLEEMHSDVRSLQPFYKEGQSRLITYQQMVDAMMLEVRAGKKVCGAFYGHPGVFACVPHKAISAARNEGFTAHMEPGISAEDCLIADLGIDPGKVGCQQFEASQFMFYHRHIDPSAYLILWQIGIAGDKSLAKFSTGPAYREVLIEILCQDYPEDHEVIIYEAATLPIHQPRMERIALNDLVSAQIESYSTLVIPPSQSLKPNNVIIKRLAELDNSQL